MQSLTEYAESLAAGDPEKLRQLSHEAVRIVTGAPTPPVEMDDDPVLALLKECMGLSLADKRRLNVQLASIIRREARRVAS